MILPRPDAPPDDARPHDPAGCDEPSPAPPQHDPGPPPTQDIRAPDRPSRPPALHPDGRYRAGDYILGAARIQAEVAAKPSDPLTGADARFAGAWINAALQPLPPESAEVGAGGEVVPVGDAGNAPMLRNTVADPNYVTVDAGRDRLDLAHSAGALELGLDVSETIGAQNSLEKMLAHQLAAAHRSTMKLSAQLNRCMERMDVLDEDTRERANVQGTRLAGAMARMMTSYQQGLATLQKMRSGGQQIVTVQHVQVNEGGQALMAGRVGGGGRSARRGRSGNER